MAELVKDMKCASCGGVLEFDPTVQQLRCSSCKEITVFDKTGSVEENELSHYTDREKLSEVWEHTVTVNCKNCGGQFVINADEISGRCIYCGSTRTANLKDFPSLVPDGVVPFKVDRAKASDILKKWAKKRFWAPRDFKKKLQELSLKGIYLPFYTYDSDTFSTYTAQAGDYYYVTVPHTVYQNGKTKTVMRQERRTRWRHVSGHFEKFYDDVWITAFPEEKNGVIVREDYSKDAVKPYSPEYLSGYSAQMYSKPVLDGFSDAKGEINERIRGEIIKKINADEVAALNVDTSFENNTFKFVFAAMWLYSYQYKGKVFSAAVSGLTGRVKGKSPVSVCKVLIAILLAVLLLVGVWFLITNS